MSAHCKYYCPPKRAFYFLWPEINSENKLSKTGCMIERTGQSGIDKASPQGAAELGFISEEGGVREAWEELGLGAFCKLRRKRALTQ